MADDYYSLAKMITINDMNLAPGVPDDLLQDAPLIRALAATTASNGTQHKYVKYTGAPVVGFRAVNAGRDHDSSIDTLVTIACEILDAGFTADVELARSYKNGVEGFLEREGMRHLRTAFFTLEDQVINGTNADAGGFEGLADTLDTLGTRVLGQGGTATRTSVYVIRDSDPDTDVALVAGNSGNINMDPYTLQRIEDGTGKHFFAYTVNISAYFALQMGSIHTAVRLANVDSTGGTGTSLDDDSIFAAIKLFPSSRQPTKIVMNRDSLELLRASRTATNVTGAPAPRPTEVEGVPIIVTDAIGSAESAVS